MGRFSKSKKIGLILFFLAIFYVVLFQNGYIGVLRGANLEQDARADQYIAETDQMTQAIGEDLAGMLFFDTAKRKHTVSLYSKKQGFSLGYFFREGGSLSTVETGIYETSTEASRETAYFSMNAPELSSYTLDGGDAQPLDPNAPFVLILPKSAKVVFQNTQGDIVHP